MNLTVSRRRIRSALFSLKFREHRARLKPKMSKRTPPASRAVKDLHEVRDCIHVFIHFDYDERKVINSRPLQRLRHIHQLALSYLVYPGATHKRFEHSLGVMELAGRVFDVVTQSFRITDQIRELLPEITSEDKRHYWRRILRMAALCHDVGHLPFSHAAEKELLPGGWDHERLTREIILCDEMKTIWHEMTPPLRPEDIVKLALGPQKAKDLQFSIWETILSEIIVGDAFGVDRIDYLLRDSHHAGVAYGRFDHYRLIDTLRILQSPSTEEPALGIEQGGLHSAEALLLARYLVYSQVYFHPVRRIYDIHLRDFLSAWLPGGKFPTDVEAHLRTTDNEVTAALLSNSLDSRKPGYDPARRILLREHFRLLYERNPEDVASNPEAGLAVSEVATAKFGNDSVRRDGYTQRGGAPDFPVLLRDGRTVSSLALSETLRTIPVVAVEYVYIIPDKRGEASNWLESNRASIIKKGGKGDE